MNARVASDARRWRTGRRVGRRTRALGSPTADRPALNILIGAALLTIAAIVYHFEWDVALLRTITIAFGGVGLIALLKGLLGHEPSR